MIVECQESATACPRGAVEHGIRRCSQVRSNHPLLQVVLTTDKKMFTDRNKEDTNIEQKYVSPCAVPPTEELLPCSLLLLTFIPRERALRQRARSIS